MTVPTLLVGLGGTGTKIVDMVYGMADDQTKNSIAVHGFDTDVNDLGKLKKLKNHLTQTSDNLTVWTSNNLCRGGVHTWFPDLKGSEDPLGRKPLTEGAGQVRVVSRLAYYWTMQQYGLDRFKNDVSRLFLVDGAGENRTARVIIVSTLAGGTGAGIFLQTALYLRHLLSREYNQNAIIIRGLFLLPDVLVTSRVTQPGETNTLRANAYASLKELNAIIRSLRGSEERRNTIDLEFMPGQDNTAVDMVPYDSVFLLDYENTDDKHLGTGIPALERYIRQAADALYLQLFTPIGEQNRSQEDNLIRQLVEQDGLNLYASCGVAKLVYPFEDLVRYCALNAVEENLSGQWLHIDQMFQRELERYRQAQRRGEIREKPNVDKFFLTQLEDLGGTGSRHPFFTPLYRTTQILDKHNRPTGSKAHALLEAIKELVGATLNKKRQYMTFLEELRDLPREKRLRDKKQIMAEVQTTEDLLFALRQHVLNELIPETITPLISRIVLEDTDADSCLAGNDAYRLNTWLLQKPEPLHPLAIRYFLYDLAQELEETISGLREGLQSDLDWIQKYDTVYDIEDTEDIEEDAVLRVRIALKQGALSAFFGKSELKIFAEEYLTAASRMKATLAAYTRNKILHDVCSTLLAAVREFSEDWQRFFAGLGTRQLDIKRQINLLEIQHTRESDPTIIHVLASREEKKDLWQEVRQAYTNDASTDLHALWRHLYCDMFTRFFKGFWAGAGTVTGQAGNTGLTHELLVWHIRQLSDHPMLNAPVMAIVRRHGLDPAALLTDVRSNARPWLGKSMTGSGRAGYRNLSYWGMHPDNLSQLSDSEKRDGLGDIQCIAEPAFSQYEVICYANMYGLMAQDLKKFQSNSLQGNRGCYFDAYQKERKNLLNDPAHYITHHLDKRWHLNAYMPDLNDEFARIDEEQRRRAFLSGIILDRLQANELDGQTIWQFLDTTLQEVKVHGRLVEEGYFNIFDALDYNPGIVDSIIQYASKQQQADLKKFKTDLARHAFFKGCFRPDNMTIFDVVLSFSGEHTDRDLRPVIEQLLGITVDMIFEYANRCHGPDKRNRARKAATEQSKDLLEKTRLLDGMDQATKKAYQLVITEGIKKHLHEDAE